jgi:LmbE family N-acetylglucosaminyl deacetylase
MPFRVLCLFPHPDDESFLIGGSIAAMTAAGHDVCLYTCTRGESSRHASRLGIAPDELGRRRALEVRHAAEILGISVFIQGDYPDGGLRDIDPRILEVDIRQKILELQPDVLITFDVQGSSVHPDHIVMHHVVKRVFVDVREMNPWLQRLAFCVLPLSRTASWPRKVFGVPDNRIHVRIPVAHVREIEHAAIHAHESVLGDVHEHNHDNWMLWEEECYSLFGETFSPPVHSLFHDMVPQRASVSPLKDQK